MNTAAWYSSQESTVAGGAYPCSEVFQDFRKLQKALAVLKAKTEFALTYMEISLWFAVKGWDDCSVWKEDVLQA